MVANDNLDTGIKAKLDDSELSDDLPKALQKVDLDLDDAPFLEDEKPAPTAEEDVSEPVTAPDQPERQKPSRKKLLILGAIIALVLAGAATAFFLLRKPAAPPPVQTAPETGPGKPPRHPPPPPPPEPIKPRQEIVMTMEPFLVEMTDTQGLTHFLTIRFTAVTQDPAVELELKRNTIVVRDAVYYYLKNKSMAFLTDKNNTDNLKKDVLSVVNQFIGAQPLDNLLIEDYLVR